MSLQIVQTLPDVFPFDNGLLTVANTDRHFYKAVGRWFDSSSGRALTMPQHGGQFAKWFLFIHTMWHYAFLHCDD
jgi:hypothetical protein